MQGSTSTMINLSHSTLGMEILSSTPPLAYKDEFIVPLPTAHSQPPIVPRELANMFRLVNFGILSSLISLFGIIANVINMIVFYTQGFTTITNISFFALALSDMCCLVTVQFSNICLNPYLDTDNTRYIFKEIQYLSLAWWHVNFGRITSWITVFITAERCLGITLPLKVKQIITLRRTTISMCLIFVINSSMLLPEYCIAYLDWKFVPIKNRTVFGLVYKSNTHNFYGLIFAFTSTSGVLSFVAVSILTMFLVVNLERKSRWRKRATGGSDNSEAMSSRDKKTMKMIIMIAAILIVCYIPGTSISFAAAFVPDVMINRAYENSFFTVWSIAFVFNSLNSSVNLLLYYRMSTKYRQTFNELFPKCIKADRQPSVD